VIDIGNDVRDYLGLPLHDNVDELIIQSELARSLVSGCRGALKRGSLGSFSHANVRCTITKVEANGGLTYLNSMPGSLRAAASNAVSSTLNSHKLSCSILEPIMGLEITVPSNMVGIVVSDLSSRRGSISDVNLDDKQVTEDTNAMVMGEVPLAEMLGYANTLRSLTGGEGAFSAEYKGHSPCSVMRF
jgi:elongation factor G